jgi:hypothetical protein
LGKSFEVSLLDELAGVFDELEETLLETLELACASLELERASFDEDSSALDDRCSLEEKVSLDEEFSFAKLSGGFAGNSPLELSHPNQAHAVQKRKNFPSILWNLFVMGQTFLSID